MERAILRLLLRLPRSPAGEIHEVAERGEGPKRAHQPRETVEVQEVALLPDLSEAARDGLAGAGLPSTVAAMMSSAAKIMRRPRGSATAASATASPAASPICAPWVSQASTFSARIRIANAAVLTPSAVATSAMIWARTAAAAETRDDRSRLAAVRFAAEV